MELNSSRKHEKVVLLTALFLPVVLALVNFELITGMGGRWMHSAYSVGKFIQFSIPVFWIGLICRQQWFLRKPNSRGLLEGIAFGLLIAVTMISIYHFGLKFPGGILGPDSEGAEIIQSRMTTLGYRSIPVFIMLGVTYSLIHSGLEEYYWRWFVFGLAEKMAGKTIDLLVSSIGFTFHHIVILGNFFGFDSLWTWFLSLCIGVGGAYWCLLYRRSDSIWGPWIGHALIDGAIFVIAHDIVFA